MKLPSYESRLKKIQIPIQIGDVVYESMRQAAWKRGVSSTYIRKCVANGVDHRTGEKVKKVKKMMGKIDNEENK